MSATIQTPKQEHYAIVAKIGQLPPTDDKPGIYFIIAPAGSSNQLMEVIREAAKSIPLAEVPSAQLHDQVRSASLIVADCTPLAPDASTDDNVLYELGLAASLRKPILLITTDRTDLPDAMQAAIKRGEMTRFHHVAADLADTYKRPLCIWKIEQEMRKLMEHCTNPKLVDNRFSQDTWPTKLLKANFWDCFQTVVSETIAVRASVVSIQSADLDYLKSKVASEKCETAGDSSLRKPYEKLEQDVRALEPELGKCIAKWGAFSGLLSDANVCVEVNKYTDVLDLAKTQLHNLWQAVSDARKKNDPISTLVNAVQQLDNPLGTVESQAAALLSEMLKQVAMCIHSPISIAEP